MAVLQHAHPHPSLSTSTSSMGGPIVVPRRRNAADVARGTSMDMPLLPRRPARKTGRIVVPCPLTWYSAPVARQRDAYAIPQERGCAARGTSMDMPLLPRRPAKTEKTPRPVWGRGALRYGMGAGLIQPLPLLLRGFLQLRLPRQRRPTCASGGCGLPSWRSWPCSHRSQRVR